MVAECRYADTGVGAAIAFGSQNWNGNCALLVSAPRRIRVKVTSIELVAADQFAGSQHRIELVAAHDMAQQEHARHQAQARRSQ